MSKGREYEIGYGKPPTANQFKKGRSGNRRGRPPKRKRTLPHDQVLGQMVTVFENGREKRITAAEAFLLNLTKQGMEGNGAAARASLMAIDAARSARLGSDQPYVTLIIRRAIEPGSVGCAASALRMVTRYGRGKNGMYKLNPWIVQTAVDRIDRPLCVENQRKVWDVTKQPEKVEWPHWWVWRG